MQRIERKEHTMIIQKPKKQQLRPACMQDIKKDNHLIDRSGDTYKILEVVFEYEMWKMLIQNVDKRRTKHVPCSMIDQYMVHAC